MQTTNGVAAAPSDAKYTPVEFDLLDAAVIAHRKRKLRRVVTICLIVAFLAILGAGSIFYIFYKPTDPAPRASDDTTVSQPGKKLGDTVCLPGVLL